MDLYALLQIKQTATMQEIKQAFYELAKKYHPDSNQAENSENENGNREMFERIRMAYEVLSCEVKRREYDSYRGRSYYENQYQESYQGEEFNENENNENDGPPTKEKFKANYSGYEWFWLTPN